MSFSSISDIKSLEESLENTARCQEDQTKRKKIRKDRKKRSKTHPISHEHQIKNIYEFITQNGNDYFSSKLNELINQYKNQYKTQLHIKSILGQDQNVYNIKNYQMCEKQAKEYLDLVNLLSNVKYEKIALKSKSMRIIVELCHAKRRDDNSKRHHLNYLSKTQSFLFRKRRDFFGEIEDFLKKMTHNLKENQNMDHIDKEILTLCKLNTIQENSLVERFNILAAPKVENKLQNAHLQCIQPENSLNDEYISLLIKKNLRKAFDEAPIDLLNYFKIAENNERNISDDVPLKRLSSPSELKQYLKNKKHKFGKHQQHSLKTCCSGCFSNHYQIYNPIETCTECGMRMHRYCQKIKGKCQRCKYIRKTVEEKSQFHFCSICQRGNEKGLLIQSANNAGKEEYVHTFCLLVHEKWRVADQNLVLNIPQGNSTLSHCKFCQKEASYYLNCSCCNKAVHGMCAYLSGCSFSMQESGTIHVSCCNPQPDQERLSFERKFKLNYEKLLYKKGSQFYSTIQST